MPKRRVRRARAGRLSVVRSDTLAGFWFTTALVGLIGPLLFGVILAVDKRSGNAGLLAGLVISPDSARTILGSIAGSLITIASLTASLTIVTLQLLSSQYTPRAVRGFLRRRIAQVVSGAFIGIFLFSLLMLVAVREPGDENEPFVPSLGVVSAIVLAVAGLMLLVLFVDRLSKTIQVSTMTGEIARGTLTAIESWHLAGPDRESPVIDRPPRSGPVTELRAQRAGFVRAIDASAFTDLPADLLSSAALEVTVKPGQMVTPGSTVIRWSGPAGQPWSDRLSQAVLIGDERDLEQDPAYGVRQLVDIALKALSPGINDPSTAVTCIGYLTGIYESLAARDLPAARDFRTDAGLHVLVADTTFGDYLHPAAEIATYGRGDPRVMVAWVAMLGAAARACAEAGTSTRLTEIRELAEDGLRPFDLDAAARLDTTALQAELDRFPAPANAEAVERQVS